MTIVATNHPNDGKKHIEFAARLNEPVVAWIEETGCERPEVIYRREPFGSSSIETGFTVVVELAFIDPTHASAFKIRWF